MTYGISHAVHNACGGIKQLEPIQVITPGKRTRQNEKEYRQMLHRVRRDLDGSAAREAQKS